MRLTDKERDILRCAQLQANAPVAAIRKLTGYRDHSIRYALRRAEEDGVVRRGCFVNLCLFGFTQYEIYFSLSTEKKHTRMELLQALIESPRISWAGELGGDYHYGMNICVRNIREVADFLEDLSRRLGLVFLEKAIAARLSLHYFGNKFLSDKTPPVKYLSYEVTHNKVLTDETDHQILAALMNTESHSRRDLARKTAIPFSTLEYRLKKLEQNKVIVGYYYHILPEMIGVQSFLLLVCLKGFSQRLRKRFFSFCQDHPQIILLIEAIGNWDFELEIQVQDSREVLAITQELHDTFGTYLHSIKALPCFSYAKIREYPFVDYDSSHRASG